MFDKTEPTSTDQDVTDSWSASVISTCSSATSVITDAERAVIEQAIVPRLESMKSTADGGEVCSASSPKENPQAFRDNSTSEPPLSAHWSATNPTTTGTAFGQSPWFRMVVTQGCPVDSMRDLQTIHNTDTCAGKWSFGGGTEAPVTTDGWSRVDEHASTDHFLSPTMPMTSCSTNKFGVYINSQNGALFETIQRIKTPEQHPPINLHHTLRDVIASTLDSAMQHETESVKRREELAFQTSTKNEPSTSGLRLPSPQTRVPSLTVKIQMPLQDSSSYMDSNRRTAPVPTRLTDEALNKYAHVKKPLNAFMLFMKEKRAQVMAECTLKESAAINQILGRKWHALSREEQAKYYGLARVEKERHQRMYPGWSARDNYACQVKRRKKRASRDNARYTAKSTGVPFRSAFGHSRQSFVPVASIHKQTSLLSGQDMSGNSSTSQQHSRFPRYISGNNPTYQSMSPSYSNEAPWSTDPFKVTAYSGTHEFNANESYLRNELTESAVEYDHSALTRHTARDGGQSAMNESASVCCQNIQNRSNHFDAHVSRPNRRSYNSPFVGPGKQYEVEEATSLKLTVPDRDRESPYSYNFGKSSRDDPLMKFAIPFQTRESLLHTSSMQWPTDSLTLDAACAKFAFSCDDRFSRPPCAPVPDLLQSTRGSDLSHRIPRSVCSPPQSNLPESIANSRLANQSDLNSFGPRDVAASVAAAAAAAAAFTLKASSLNSDLHPVYGYETRHYSSDPSYMPVLQATSTETTGLGLSTHLTDEGEFKTYEKKDNYIPPLQNPDI